MPIPVVWGLAVAFGLLAWSVAAAQYFWPRISKRERTEAMRPILVLHGFRYIGLGALIPGIAASQLSITASRERQGRDSVRNDLSDRQRCEYAVKMKSLDAASVWHAAPHLASWPTGGLLAVVAGAKVPDAAS